ncbi:hypothetical protein [Adhaeribacter rhizoryzae]|uniref:Uncharacterized protein n=1 Tax=Adhaeribacter rhizoryzae TaxID=2607907 RepID=A0A5M6CUB2_9BACT|nr:hypothetical protein [Adhaeribacter rhizoryzae]KAA5538847.1 hypothetical protein F0145_25420 [Adhaeribacter rhizoryzae]
MMKKYILLLTVFFFIQEATASIPRRKKPLAVLRFEVWRMIHLPQLKATSGVKIQHVRRRGVQLHQKQFATK